MEKQSIDKNSYTLTPKTTQVSKNSAGQRERFTLLKKITQWQTFHHSFCCFLLSFSLHSSLNPCTPLPNSATTSSEVGVYEWGGRSQLLSGYKIPLSLPFAFEVELLYNWARRVCRLRRLLHLKFGRAVTPAETWRRPGGSRLKARSDERINKDEVLLSRQIGSVVQVIIREY